MATYTVVINDLQLGLIEKALKLLHKINATDPQLNDIEADEIEIMIGMIPDSREEEKSEPGIVHGWCY